MKLQISLGCESVRKKTEQFQKGKKVPLIHPLAPDRFERKTENSHPSSKKSVRLTVSLDGVSEAADLIYLFHDGFGKTERHLESSRGFCPRSDSVSSVKKKLPLWAKQMHRLC